MAAPNHTSIFAYFLYGFLGSPAIKSLELIDCFFCLIFEDIFNLSWRIMKKRLFFDNILLFNVLFQIEKLIIENIIIFRKKTINFLHFSSVLAIRMSLETRMRILEAICSCIWWSIVSLYFYVWLDLFHNSLCENRRTFSNILLEVFFHELSSWFSCNCCHIDRTCLIKFLF